MPVTDKRLGEIQAIPDSAIDTSDIPEAGAEFFERAAAKGPPFKLGEHEEVCSLRDGGPVVAVYGKFAVVQLAGGGFYLIYGDQDCYCNGARGEDDKDSEFETLEAAKEEMSAARAEMERPLTAEYVAYVEAQGLPEASADEMVFYEGLTPDQRAWMSGFIRRWEDTLG